MTSMSWSPDLKSLRSHLQSLPREILYMIINAVRVQSPSSQAPTNLTAGSDDVRDPLRGTQVVPQACVCVDCRLRSSRLGSDAYTRY